MDHREDCELLTVETHGLCTCDFDARMRQAERDRIRDEGLARLDETAAKYGEDSHLFWLAMQFATERLRQFDARRRNT